MRIQFSPQVRADTLTVSKQGDALTINGVIYDFSSIPEGATLPGDAVDSEYLLGDVERIGGHLYLTLLLPIGPSASEAARFPAPLINPPDGPLELPQ